MLFNALYAVSLALLSPVIAYRMIRHGRYRRGVSEKLFGLSKTNLQSGAIWIHAVSVGEVNLLPGIIAAIQSREPSARVLISSSTDTGYDLAVKLFGKDRVFFASLDFTWAVRRTITTLRPRMLVLVELELWPHLIRIATENNCPVSVINGRMSERSGLRYAKFKRWLGPTFARIATAACQDQPSADRFIESGTRPSSVIVTGSIKFDNAPTTRETTPVQRLVTWSGVDPWHRVWVMGSTQSGEEAMAVSVYKSLIGDHPNLRLILVPRHRERFDEVARLVTDAGLNVRRRSEGKSSRNQDWSAETVILVDTIGELRDWWGVGHIATVGGSFGDRGGQNMLEPAGYGCAVSFGPNTRNFRVISQALIDNDAAVRVADEAELKTFVARCIDDIPAADSLGRNARAVVDSHRGAIERTVDVLLGTRPSDRVVPPSHLPHRSTAAIQESPRPTR